MKIFISNIVIILILVTFGIIICSKKKIIISRVYEQCFLVIIIWVNQILRGSGLGLGWMSFLIITFSVFIFISVVYFKNVYTIYNVDEFELMTLIDKTLEEIGVSFERKEKSIILTGFNNANIVFRSYMGAIEINLKEIRDLDAYHLVINRIKLGIKEIEKERFSYIGVFYILLGLVFFLITYWNYY